MKIARLKLGTETVLARVEGPAAYPLVLDPNESWFDPLRLWLSQGQPDVPGDVASFKSADVLAPMRAPSKIIAVGLNYKEHAIEQGREFPKAPMLFTKAPSAIVGPTDDIVFSIADSQKVDYENELAVVIGKTTRNISEADALSAVFGYMICNDVSARDAQRDDVQFFRAKSFDTFCPIGPFIVTADEIPDPQALGIRTWVNGEQRQDGTTADMIYSVASVISYCSRYMTLEPGDVITTGTPQGVGEAKGVFLKDGDVVKCEIDGLGTLENKVRTTA